MLIGSWPKNGTRNAHDRGKLFAATLLGLLIASTGHASTTDVSGEGTGESGDPFQSIVQGGEANLFTGTMTHSVPILIPPGRSSLTPELALVYSSDGGEGIFGLGWSMPFFATVERSTKHGVPHCKGSHTDDFALHMSSGTAELRFDSEDAISRKYLPESDESYTLAELVNASVANQKFWKVTERSGKVYTFGEVEGARLYAGADKFRNCVPATTGLPTSEYTSVWALTKIQDPNGNVVEITYAKESGSLYPVTVSYGGDPGSHPFVITFGKTDRNTSPLNLKDKISFRRGVREELLSVVNTITVAAPGVPQVRQYTLAYAASSSGSRALLTSVAGTLLPTRTFQYQSDEFAHVQITPDVGVGEDKIRKPQDSNVRKTMMDANGDGYADLIKADGSSAKWKVRYGTDTGLGDLEEWSYTGGSFVSDQYVEEHNTDSDTGRTAVDITGDGVLDFVDARNASTWKVYKGVCADTNASPPFACSFSGTQVDFAAPGSEIARYASGGHAKVLFLDMNGDSIPDRIQAIQSGAVWVLQVWFGIWDEVAGTRQLEALAYNYQWPATGSNKDRIVEKVGSSKDTSRALVDFNGDGLLDVLDRSNNQLSVYWNEGRTFSQTPVAIVTVNSEAWVNTQNGSSETKSDFIDLNNDGLPDQVLWDGNNSHAWDVKFNLGVSLASAEPWTGLQGPIRRNNGHGDTTVDLLDWNGDGLVDRIDAANQNWKVWLADSSTKPNAMIVAKNGLRGDIYVKYKPSTQFNNTAADSDPNGEVPQLPFPSWLVTEVRRSDGSCDSAVGSAACVNAGLELVETVSYEGGFFDPVEREFRGFRLVRTTDADGNLTEREFSQAKFTAGRMLRETRKTGAGTIVSQENMHWATVPGTVRTQVYLSEQRVEEPLIVGFAAPSARCLFTRNDAPDPYGRNTKTCTFSCDGDGATPPQNPAPVCPATPEEGQDTTTTVWANITLADNTVVRDRPQSVSMSQRRASTDYLLSSKSFQYDTLGDVGVEANLTRTQTYVDPATVYAGTASDVVVATVPDAYGNVIEVREGTLSVVDGGGGQKTKYTFPTGSPTYALYPTKEERFQTATDIHLTQKDWNIAYGAPTSETGENSGEVINRSYDAVGRVICEALPGDACNAPTFSSATRIYRYHYAAASPANFEQRLSYVEVLEREPNRPGGFVKTRRYFDGLGRERASVSDRVVEGVDATLVEGRVAFDKSGHMVTRYVPHTIASALIPGTDASRTDAGLASTVTQPATTYTYSLNGSTTEVDPLGRPRETKRPNLETTTYTYSGVRTTTLDPAAHKVESEVDDRGREAVRRIFEGGSVHITFTYAYDALGRLLDTNVSGTRTKTTIHDTFGRPVQVDDVDSGIWKYAYDANGNLFYQDEPGAGKHVELCYDDLNRITKRYLVTGTNGSGQDAHVPEACGGGTPAAGFTVTQESSYTYDGPGGGFGRGRLTSVTDLAGSETFEYDSRGRATKQSRNIIGQTATMRFSYAAGGQINTITYPDSGTGEVVQLGYQADGLPFSVHSNTHNVDYASGAGYDVFGRLSYVNHGNGTVDELDYWGATDSSNPHNGNFRLKDLKVLNGSPLDPFINIRHNYNTFGKLSGTIDNEYMTGGNLNSDYTYGYDGAGRLEAVTWGPGPAGGPNDDTFDFNSKGNLILKDDPSGTGLELGYDATKIHQVRRHGPVGSETLKMDYDDAGRRANKVGGSAEVYTYNALGQLTRTDLGPNLTTLPDHVDYRYDWAGRRVLKQFYLGANNTSTLRTWSRYADSSNRRTKYYFLGDRLIASRQTANAFAEGAPVWQVNPEPFRIPPLLALALGGGVLVLLVGFGRRPLRVRVAVAPARALGVAIVLVGGAWPTQLAAQCDPNPPPPDELTHYHLDRQGSVLAITSSTGAVLRQVRYEVYGEIRGRFDGGGTATTGSERYRHEYTGWETDIGTSLEYAGARHYDPAVGQFLTHDPEEQFASPYALGPGDPLNGSDPTGAGYIEDPYGYGSIGGSEGGGVDSGTGSDSVRTSNAGAEDDGSVETASPSAGEDSAVGQRTAAAAGAGGAASAGRGPNGGERNESDQKRITKQIERRDARREAQSRMENGQNQSGEGSRDHENAGKGPRGVRPEGPGGRHRERNVGIDEEHSRVPKGAGSGLGRVARGLGRVARGLGKAGGVLSAAGIGLDVLHEATMTPEERCAAYDNCM